MSQELRDSYLCPEHLLDNDSLCQDGEGVGRVLNTRCCPRRVSNLRQTMSDAQVDAVSYLGFASLLAVSEINIKRDLCLKLIEQLDVDGLEIKYEGVNIKISSSEMGVSWVFRMKGPRLPSTVLKSV